MKWLKKGLICNKDTLNLPWYKKNTMVPLPFFKNSNCLRIYITMCDENNIGRIGFIDVNPMNPQEIIGYSQNPIVDIGAPGSFDDNGVVTASLFQDENALYMFYSGYQSCVNVPYLIFTGLAVSYDQGDTFKKISENVPILDRIKNEFNTRCVPFVIKENKQYKMWYTADYGQGWIKANEKKLPLYDLKYLTSNSLIDWGKNGGQVAVDLNTSVGEHGIAKCSLWKEEDLYKIIYSIRSTTFGYRLGYGESQDGIKFKRMDHKIGIDVSESGWDSEMIAFAERISCNDKVYLIYCGNHYGLGGIGYAELIEK